MEKCGVTFLTVHGRTPKTKIKQPSDNDLLREIKQSIQIPLIANGDCTSLEVADAMHEKIGCDGVMAARAMLENPTLFSGKYETTPIECVQEWLNIIATPENRMKYQFYHHHFVFMMEKMIKRREKVKFNTLRNHQQLLDYLSDELDLRPQPIEVPENIVCTYDETNYRNRMRALKIEESLKSDAYDAENSLGKFFLDKAKQAESDDCDDNCFEFMQTNMFNLTTV